MGSTAVSGSSNTTVEERRSPSPGAPGDALVVVFGSVHGDPSVRLGPTPLRLGREVDGDGAVRARDPRASRRHAEIHWSELQRTHWIRDLGSRNGTYVNGRMVSREVLRRGDLIRIGGTVFRLEADPGDESRLPDVPAPLVGNSRSLRATLAQVEASARSDAPILIQGPTGTGKELLAAAVHRASGRPGPLLAVNCAALPVHLIESELFGHERGAFSGAEAARPGLFRAAHRGTLFLDEIGELSGPVQATLLRALDTRAIRAVGGVAELAVDARVVAATNRDLRGAVEAGEFRADLYARLAESVVEVAPLADRPADLAPLWHHLVGELTGGGRIELGADAFEAMALHPWPFNVRELRQLVRRVLAARPPGGELTVDDLPASMRRGGAEDAAGDVASDQPGPPLVDGQAPSPRQLRRLAEEFQGNVKEMAAFLGKDRKQVYRWLRRGDIDPAAYRRSGH